MVPSVQPSHKRTGKNECGGGGGGERSGIDEWLLHDSIIQIIQYAVSKHALPNHSKKAICFDNNFRNDSIYQQIPANARVSTAFQIRSCSCIGGNCGGFAGESVAGPGGVAGCWGSIWRTCQFRALGGISWETHRWFGLVEGCVRSLDI